MEYINAEKFLKESKEVQNLLLDWWNPSIGDLYSWSTEDGSEYNKLNCITSENIAKATLGDKCKMIPLFTEGQLRKFIEEKANCKVMIEYTSCENIVIRLCREDELSGRFKRFQKTIFDNRKWNLINAYWKIATKIINE